MVDWRGINSFCHTRQDAMKRWLRLLLQVLSLVVFGLILWLAGPDAWRQVIAGNPTHVLTAFLLLSTATVLSTVRLQLVVQSLAGQRIGSLRRFYYLSMVARAVGLVIPRSVSIFAGKPVALSALGLSLKRAVWAVLLDNLFDLVLLGVLAIPALLFLGARVSAQAALVLVLGSGLAVTAGLWSVTGGVAFLRFIGWVERMSFLSAIFPRRAEKAAHPLLRRPTAVRALGLTLLLNVALAACYHNISRAVGLSYPRTLFAAAFPAVQLSLVLAVTPGGLGLFDASWYGILLLGGVPREDALAFVIGQRAYVSIFILVCAGLSALLSLTERRGRG